MANPNASGGDANIRLGPSHVSGCPQQNTIDRKRPAIGTRLRASANLPDAGNRLAEQPPATPRTDEKTKTNSSKLIA